jgi:hypothetical protein
MWWRRNDIFVRLFRKSVRPECDLCFVNSRGYTSFIWLRKGDKFFLQPQEQKLNRNPNLVEDILLCLWNTQTQKVFIRPTQPLIFFLYSNIATCFGRITTIIGYQNKKSQCKVKYNAIILTLWDPVSHKGWLQYKFYGIVKVGKQFFLVIVCLRIVDLLQCISVKTKN